MNLAKTSQLVFFAINGSVTNTTLNKKVEDAIITNQNESRQAFTDFITFWAPILLQKEFALIQLLIDYEKIASLKTYPKLDSMKRIYMIYSKVNEDFDFVQQKFEKWNRQGFTFVEWRGSEITNIKRL